jgi:hypothetical protein
MSMLSSKTVDTVIVATAILVVLFLVAWCAAPVKAQPVEGCADIRAGADKLKQDYGETLAFRGVSIKGYLIVLFLNAETGTWSAGKIDPQDRKIMCLIDAGGDGAVHISPSVEKGGKKAEQKR